MNSGNDTILVALTPSVLDWLAIAVRHRARREAYQALTVDLIPEQHGRFSS